MRLTVEILKAWFVQFNADYFDGTLPLPRLALSHGRTRLGSMSCKRRRRWLKTEYYDFSIRVSTYYDSPERDYQNVLLHEMIHYYIAYHRLRDTSAHGRLFRKMMTDLNTRHGWQISVSRRPPDAQLWQSLRPRTTRLVLALRNSSGQCFLTVVNPNYARSINHRLKLATDITWHRWYHSDDVYFQTFPVVRTLRGRRVSTDELEWRTASLIPEIIK